MPESLKPRTQEGAAWQSQIMNRTFKARVIDLVMLRLPQMLLEKHPDKRLILDYRDVVEYSMTDGRIVARELALRPLGEADVKFTRYADMYQKLVIDSIDGDSVPIALVHHERCLSQGVCPPRMAIYRMEVRA